MAITIDTPKLPPVLEVPAHRLQQGGRTVYYMALPIAQFDDVLPDEVHKDVIKENNRRFIPNHAGDIERYLQSNDAWLLGPVILSIARDYVEFEPYPGQLNDSSPVLGLLRVVSGGGSFLRMLDGQHRRRAIRDYRRSQSLSGSEIERRNRFESCQMPVALYEEGDLTLIRQMFADMARQRNIDAIAKARFDTRDPFNRAADQIKLRSSWIGPYVEMHRSTIARASDKLISFNQLATNLKTLEFGYFGRASKDRLQEADNNMEGIIEKGLKWTDDFLPMAREEYLNLFNSDVDQEEVPKERSKTLAYNGTMLRILAGAYYEWHQRFPAMGADILSSFISDMDLQLKAKDGPLVEAGVLVTGNTTLTARRQEVTAAIEGVVQGAHDEHQNKMGL